MAVGLGVAVEVVMQARARVSNRTFTTMIRVQIILRPLKCYFQSRQKIKDAYTEIYCKSIAILSISAILLLGYSQRGDGGGVRQSSVTGCPYP